MILEEFEDQLNENDVAMVKVNFERAAGLKLIMIETQMSDDGSDEFFVVVKL